MSQSDESSQDPRPTQRRKSRAGLIAVIGSLALLLLVGILLLDHYLPQQIAKWLREYAVQQGVALELESVEVRTNGTKLKKFSGAYEGVAFKGDQLSVDWEFSELLEARVDSVRLDHFDLSVDLDWAFSELEQAQSPGEKTGEPALKLKDIRLPFREVLVPEMGIHLLRGESSFDFVFSQTAIENGPVFESVSSLTGQDFEMSARTDVSFDTSDWNCQLAVDWLEPLDIIKRILPSGHPAHPDSIMPPMLESFSIHRLSVEGIVSGNDMEMESASSLVELERLHFQVKDAGHLTLSNVVAASNLSKGEVVGLSAGVNVASLDMYEVVSEPFQLSLGLIEGDVFKLELPEAALKHSSGGSGTLSLRSFVRLDENWKPADAEFQVALRDLSYQDMEVDPFRIYANFSEQHISSKISALSLPDFDTLRLVSTRMDMELSEEYSPLSFRGESSIELSAKALQLATVAAVGTYGETGWDVTLDMVGEISEPLGEVSVHLGDDGSVKASGSGSWNVIDVVPYVFYFAPDQRGTVGEGTLSWKLNAAGKSAAEAEASLSVDLESVGLEKSADGISVKGINSSIQLQLAPEVRTVGEQQIVIDQVSVAEEVIENIRISWGMSGLNEFQMHSLTAECFGGQLRLTSFSCDPAKPTFQTMILYENIDAGQIVSRFDAIDFEVVGRLDGGVPVQLIEGRPWPKQGLLRARSTPQAVLYFKNEEQIKQYIQLPEQLDLRKKFVAAVMAGVKLDYFEIDFFNPDKPREPLLVRMSGRTKTKDIDLQGLTIHMPHRTEHDMEYGSWESIFRVLTFFSPTFSN